MKIALCFFLLLGTVNVSAKAVTFSSGKVSLHGVYLEPTKVSGPAVLLLHGCGRAASTAAINAERLTRMSTLLQEMGFGVLMLDVKPKAHGGVACAEPKRKPNAGLRANEAQIAIAWLKARSEIDPTRVAVMGWSQGASALLALLNRDEPGIRSAVAFYPDCSLFLGRDNYRISAPTLLLVGEDDRRSSAEACRQLGKKTGQDLFHQVTYPDVEHDFDAIHAALRASAAASATKPPAAPNTVAAQDAWRRSFKWLSRWFDPGRSMQGVPPVTLP